MSERDFLFNCPCCGQGGLIRAILKAPEPKRIYICEECDRVWGEPHRLGLNNSRFLEDVLAGLQLAGDWDCIKEVARGVPWNALDSDLQKLLERRDDAGG